MDFFQHGPRSDEERIKEESDDDSDSFPQIPDEDSMDEDAMVHELNSDNTQGEDSDKSEEDE